MDEKLFQNSCASAAADLEAIVQKYFSNLKGDLIIKTVSGLPKQNRHDAIQRINAAWGNIDDAIRLLTFKEKE